jgi:poly(ADP-ribose) glycohydrolase
VIKLDHFGGGFFLISKKVRNVLTIMETFFSSIELPNYDPDNWELTISMLSRPCKSFNDIIKLIKFFSSTDYTSESSLLTLFNENEENLPKLEQKYYEERVFPELINIALELPNHFPCGKIISNNTHEKMEGFEKITLTQRKMNCLLSHMFLCTMSDKKTHLGSFKEWNSSELPSAKLYLKVLMIYFNKIITFNYEVDMNDEMIICYKSLSDDMIPIWANSNITLINSIKTNIYDIPGRFDEIEIDSSNKLIGFGKSGTAEEILFGCSPELCVITLFCNSMSNKETILIKNAKKVIQHSGYGPFNVKYEYEIENWWKLSNRKERTIIAMDASEFDHIDSLKNSLIEQLKDNSLIRELNKAYCGFSWSQNFKNIKDIGIGFWGCGTFGGDKDVKFVIQWIAASQINNNEKNMKLIIYAFNNIDYEQRIIKFIEKYKNFLIKDLWKLLKDYENYIKNFNDNNREQILPLCTWASRT